MSEELKPCPQCGGQVRRNQNIWFMCSECEMELSIDYNGWWYNKEIDPLRFRYKELEEQTASTMKKLLDEKERSKILVEALEILKKWGLGVRQTKLVKEALKKYEEMLK